MHFTNMIETREQLRQVIPEPGPTSRAAIKDIDHIDDVCRQFIAASPFLVLSTRGSDGLMDMSPKGDPAGFVHVLDDKTLAIPDRLGNSRIDSFENLMTDPSVGLIFLIPGNGATLRVSGTASLTADPNLRARFEIDGKPPKLVLIVDIQHAFMHCSKCMVRSKMWKPEGWPDQSEVPTLAQAMVAHGKLKDTVQEMHDMIVSDEKTKLY